MEGNIISSYDDDDIGKYYYYYITFLSAWAVIGKSREWQKNVGQYITKVEDSVFFGGDWRTALFADNNL